MDGIQNITTEEVMDKRDLFQARFGKVYESIWWDMDIIKTDTGMQFTSKKVKEDPYVSKEKD